MVILCHKRCEDVLSHISVSTPSTDLCFVCQKNNLAIQQSSSLSDEAKAERLATAQEYLLLAHKERQYYKSQVKVAVNAFESQDEADKPIARTTSLSKSIFLLAHSKLDPSILRPHGNVAYLEYTTMGITHK